MKMSSKRKQNLEGLLRLAVENSGKAESGSNTNSCETDAEGSEFLQAALNSMNIDNFGNALAILNSESTNTAQKLEGLDAIRNNIDDIDLANSFVKVGGITTVLEFIRKPNYDLRTQSIYIVAEMAQNNEFCQNYFLKQNVIPTITATMNDADENLARGSIYAISSLTQNFSPGLKEFLRINGIQSLLSCLKSTHTTVYIKSAFLIGSLSSNDSLVRGVINKHNAAPILLNNLNMKDEYDDKLEATLFALSALSVDSNWTNTLKKHKEAEGILKQIISSKSLKESCEEMVTFARNILKG